MAQIKTTSGHRLSSMDGPRTPTIPTTEFWDKIHELCDELERAGTSPIPSTIHLLRTSTPAFETSSSAQVEEYELSYGLEDRTREELPPLDRFDLSTNQPHWNDPSSPPCFRVGWIEPSDDEIARVSDDILWNPTTPCSDADSPPPSPSSPSPSSSSTSEVSQPDGSDAFDRWQRSQSCAPLPSQLSTLEETRPLQMQTSLSTPTLTVAQTEEEAWEVIGAAWRSGIPAGETAPSSDQPLESQTPSSPTLARNDDAAWEAVVRAHRAEGKAGRLVPPPQRPSSSSSYARELTRGITAQDEERSDRWYSLFCPLVEDLLDVASPPPESPPSFVSAALEQHQCNNVYFTATKTSSTVHHAAALELEPFIATNTGNIHPDRLPRLRDPGDTNLKCPSADDRYPLPVVYHAERRSILERRSFRLPPEVLARVFHFLRFPIDGGAFGRADVLRAALACTAWVHEAIRVLYTFVSLHDAGDMRKFELAHYVRGTHVVKELSIERHCEFYGKKRACELLVEATVECCRGLRDFTLINYGVNPRRLFYLDAMKDVTKLILDNCRIHRASLDDREPLPPILKNLTHLKVTDSQWPSTSSSTPLLAAVANSLQNLHLFIGPLVQVGNEDVPIFPQLSHLFLTGEVEKSAWLLGRCPALTHLEFVDAEGPHIHSALSTLPPTCKLHQICISTDAFIEQVNWESTFALPVLSDLKIVTLRDVYDCAEERDHGWRDDRASFDAWAVRFREFLVKRKKAGIWVQGDVEDEVWGGLERLWYE